MSDGYRSSTRGKSVGRVVGGVLFVLVMLPTLGFVSMVASMGCEGHSGSSCNDHFARSAVLIGGGVAIAAWLVSRIVRWSIDRNGVD